MAKMLTPAEFAEKHNRRTKAAIADVQRGVQSVTESPTAKAAQAQDKMLNNLTAAVQSGKWKRGLQRVGLDEWKEKTLAKVNRIGPGLDAAQDKVEAFAGELLPHIEDGQRKISDMPDLTLEDSIARMTEFTRHMAKFQRGK